MGVGIVALVVVLIVAGVMADPAGKTKTIIASGFVFPGYILAAASGLWFLIEAFKKSVVWGLLVFCVPFVSLVFLVMHWNDARWPFLANLAGWAMVVAGLVVRMSGTM